MTNTHEINLIKYIYIQEQFAANRQKKLNGVIEFSQSKNLNPRAPESKPP
jgi:hypothetical protein